MLIENGSTVSSRGFDAAGSGAVTVEANDFTLKNGSTLSTNIEDGLTAASGDAGLGVFVRADQVAILDEDLPQFAGQATGLLSDSEGTGTAGSVIVDARRVDVSGGVVSANADAAGPAGNTSVTATEAVVLRREAVVSTNSAGGGAAGAVTVSAPTVSVESGASISSQALGGADSGSVTVDAAELTLSDGASALTIVQDGVGGDILLSAGVLTIADQITATGGDVAGARSDSTGEGDAGGILVDVAELTMTGGQISANALGAGLAGDVAVEASVAVRMDGGASIATSSSDGGNAGSVTVATPALLAEGGSKIASEGVGDASSGTIAISASDLTILSGALVSTNVQDGVGGGVAVAANTLTITDNAAASGEPSETGLVSNSTGGGDAGGISVNAGDAFLSGGVIAAEARGQGDAGIVEVEATSAIVLEENARVATNSEGGGDAGTVRVAAPDVIVRNGASIASVAEGDAASGRINVEAARLMIRDGGSIDNDVIDGAGGVVQVSANRIEIEDLGEGGTGAGVTGVFSDSLGAGVAGDVTIDAGGFALTGGSITADANGAGRGGDIDIDVARTLTMTDGAQIASNSKGAGEAGTIRVDANRLRLKEAEISADALDVGAAGDIRISATEFVRIGRDGRITSSAVSGVGDAGDVRLESALVTIAGGRIETSATGAALGGSIRIGGKNDNGALALNAGVISSSTRGSGAGGDILIQFGEVGLSDGASIEANSINGGGAAGQIDVFADSILVDGGSQIATASRGAPSTDVAEALIKAEEVEIDIRAGQMIIRNGSRINATGQNGADGGDIRINAGNLLVTGADSSIASSALNGAGDAGSSTVRVGAMTLSGGASISTNSAEGAGGQVDIRATDRITLTNGDITTSVASGAENGGDVLVRVDDGFIVLNQGSQILAQAVAGDGGAMTIQMEALYRTRSTAISASSTLGFDGPVVISGLENPETAEAGELPSDFLDANAVIANPCLAAYLGRSQLLIAETGLSVRVEPVESPLMAAAATSGVAIGGGERTGLSTVCGDG